MALPSHSRSGPGPYGSQVISNSISLAWSKPMMSLRGPVAIACHSGTHHSLVFVDHADTR